jgi:lysophospholipase L1-like esterase
MPVLYFQAKKIRRNTPVLSEAKENEGRIFNPEIKKEINVVILGESTIAGVGVEKHVDGFAGAFATELCLITSTNIRWKVHAKSGYTVKMILHKILPGVIDSKTDLVVIGIGANDAFTLNNPRKWRRDIQVLIEKIKVNSPKALIAFNNMPPIKEFPAFTPLAKFIIGNLVELLGQELNLISKSYENVIYNGTILKLDDWIDKFDKNYTQDDFFCDGVHPSKLTYQTWGKDFAKFVGNYISTTRF